MYFSRLVAPAVRDSSPPPYGNPTPDPPIPARQVLDDLPDAADGPEAARILARYAALRWWLLQDAGAAPVLTTHARDAARAHLRALREAWSEGGLLARLLRESPGGARAPALLAAAAAEASWDRHAAGAAALRAAAREAALRRLR